jgi:pimeloyl-ACP methyl ester carboxylesterase
VADDLACSGYLVWNQDPVRDVFLVINGSGLLSNAFVHPTFEEVMGTHRIAYSTYDKPGVWAPFGDPAAVHRDGALLQRYTLGHGVECATKALRWAREQFGPTVRLHLRGHSEGTLVALYTYDALLDTDPGMASSIVSLVLSGLALDPFGDILEQQLLKMPDGGRVRAALASCDWAMLSQRLGVSCAYIEDAERRPSGRAMFERLAARAPAARFYVFHGTHDWNTPVGSVRALQAWNASDKRLRMEFHYYDGGHTGTDAVRAEVSKVLTQLVSE